MVDRKKTRRFQGDIWFQKQVTERTKQSLIHLEEEFAKEHKSNTDAELLEYVCEFAKELGRTPNAGEIIGGRYISSRFDGWSNVVASAKLPQTRKMPEFEKRFIYKKEYRRQEALLRQERISEKDTTKALRRQKDADGRAKEEERQTRDALWAVDHEKDTDEQLVDYVCRCASELGHSPLAQEVEGASYIAQRFGSWALALTVADLPLPAGVKPVNPKTLKLYLERQKKTDAE